MQLRRGVVGVLIQIVTEKRIDECLTDLTTELEDLKEVENEMT